MYLYQLLDENSIKVSLEAKTKEDVLVELVELLCKSHNISESETILKGIGEREDQMSTGIGNGIAVPHCKSSVVNKLVAALGIARDGIEFGSADEKPAKIFFILIAELDNPGPHIKALAKLAHLLKSASLRDDLINAASSEDILSKIKNAEESV